jgi:hypothetical protein
MLDGDIRAEKVDKRTVLSASFIGGPRDMRRRYMDAMTLVRKFGKPDIFITMICNPNWDEIRRELIPKQTLQDRLDLVVRVFHAKLQELNHRLTKQDILGKVRAYVYVVEFQKRGLPHAHVLLIMQRKYKLACPEQYDLLISAEIPSNKYPELRKMVINHMMHGPCGSLNLTAHALRVVNRARIIALGLSVTQPCKGRILTLFTDVVTMTVKKRSEGANWTIDGLSLITHTSFVSSTVTSMSRHVGASRLLNTCSRSYIKAMIVRLLL